MSYPIGCSESNFSQHLHGQTDITPVSNKKIKVIQTYQTEDKIAPYVKRFRERGNFSSGAYGHLLDEMCIICEVPMFRNNYPKFEIIGTDGEVRAHYSGSKDLKLLVLSKDTDVRGFLILWYLYLQDRNALFVKPVEWAIEEDTPKTPPYSIAKGAANRVFKQSKPTLVRNLKKRSFIICEGI